MQPFSKFLEEELGYSKKQIDIAVFEDEKKLADDLIIIVECKIWGLK